MRMSINVINLNGNRIKSGLKNEEEDLKMLFFPNIFSLITNTTLTAIGVVMYIIFMIAAWNIFEKAGEAGWKAIIPIWNMYILFKITWGIGLLFLLMLVPIVGTIISLITSYKLAKVFGHGIGYTLGLIFFPWLFWLILGFGSDEYLGI